MNRYSSSGITSLDLRSSNTYSNIKSKSKNVKSRSRNIKSRNIKSRSRNIKSRIIVMI